MWKHLKDKHQLKLDSDSKSTEDKKETMKTNIHWSYIWFFRSML